MRVRYGLAGLLGSSRGFYCLSLARIKICNARVHWGVTYLCVGLIAVPRQSPSGLVRWLREGKVPALPDHVSSG